MVGMKQLSNPYMYSSGLHHIVSQSEISFEASFNATAICFDSTFGLHLSSYIPVLIWCLLCVLELLATTLPGTHPGGHAPGLHAQIRSDLP